MHVLIVDDDPHLAGLTRRMLEGAQHDVRIAHTAAEGTALALATDFDAVLLDLRLPDRSGLDVVRALREAGRDTPVLIVTGTAEEAAMIRGLDAGADDYLLKPVSGELLRARLRAVVRRRTPPQGSALPPLARGPLALDRLARTVSVDGAPLPVTPKEFALLEQLLLAGGQPVTRAELLERVWGRPRDGSDNLLDAHVARLRQKLQAATPTPAIRTVRGVGFALRD